MRGKSFQTEQVSVSIVGSSQSHLGSSNWPPRLNSPPDAVQKVWAEPCRATKAIRRRFGAKSALDYLIGEKLIAFAEVAKDDAAFAREFLRFLAAVWDIFNEYEIAGYVATRRPAERKSLRQLLYLRVERAVAYGPSTNQPFDRGRLCLPDAAHSSQGGFVSGDDVLD